MRNNNDLASSQARLKTVQFSTDAPSGFKQEFKRNKFKTNQYENDLLAEENRKTVLLLEKLRLRYYHVAAQVPKIRMKTEMNEQRKTMDLFFNPNLLTHSKYEPNKKFAHNGLSKDIKVEQVEALLRVNKNRFESSKNKGVMFVNELWDRNYYQKILHNSQLLRKVRNLEDMKPKNKEEIFTNFKKHFSMKHAVEKNEYFNTLLNVESPRHKKSEVQAGFFTSREDGLSFQKADSISQNNTASPRRAQTSMNSRENVNNKSELNRASVLDLARLKRFRMKNNSASLTEGTFNSLDTIGTILTPRSFNISQVISECEALIDENKKCHKFIIDERYRLSGENRIKKKTKNNAVNKQIEREIQRSFKDRKRASKSQALLGEREKIE